MSHTHLRRLLPGLVAVLCQMAVVQAATPAVPGGVSSLPRPWCIAHRGGGLLWPEHTMEAYQASTERGNNFVEVDCYLLKDGAIGIMHDHTLDRTTNAKGSTDSLDARGWSKIFVDGKKLLGEGWGTYRAPFLDEVLVRYGGKKILFIEPKDGRSGRAIVSKLKEFRVPKDWVVVNSFYPEQLRPAISAGYLACLNLQDMKTTPAKLKKMGLWGVCCPFPVTEEYIKALKAAGLNVIGYNVNRHFERDELLRWGVDGYYTDEPVYLDVQPRYLRDKDPFIMQKYLPAMLPAQSEGRGNFIAPDKWSLDATSENHYYGCLHGWLSPIKNGGVASEWTIELSVTFGPGISEGRWAGLAVLTTDHALVSDVPPHAVFGYNFLFHNNGAISIYKYAGHPQQSPVLLGITPGRAVQLNVTRRFRIHVTPNTLRTECLDSGANLSIDDGDYRGGYVTLGAKGQQAAFSKIELRMQ